MNTYRFTPALPLLAALLLPAGMAHAEDTVDLGTKVPDAKTVKEGLFPEDTCKELEAAGFKCMGFKPAVRFSLPAASFQRGSAELPGELKAQLDSFASVLKEKRGTEYKIVIVGHTDATGSDTLNDKLSRQRAAAVKAYLVQNGVDPSMLDAAGVGARDLKNPSDPDGGENRRVEIGRKNPNQ